MKANKSSRSEYRRKPRRDPRFKNTATPAPSQTHILTNYESKHQDAQTPRPPQALRVSLTPSLASVPAANPAVVKLVPTLLKIGRVLVPVDFSDCSLKLLHYAVRFGEQFGSKLILAHVIESYPIDYVLGPQNATDSNQWRFEKARTQLERMCESLAWPRTVCAERVVLFGKPFHQICDAAKERSIDLIIIATHGRTGLQRLQLGSTAERVVRHAPCPLLVVREREKEFA